MFIFIHITFIFVVRKRAEKRLNSGNWQGQKNVNPCAENSIFKHLILHLNEHIKWNKICFQMLKCDKNETLKPKKTFMKRAENQRENHKKWGKKRGEKRGKYDAEIG